MSRSIQRREVAPHTVQELRDVYKHVGTIHSNEYHFELLLWNFRKLDIQPSVGWYFNFHRLHLYKWIIQDCWLSGADKDMENDEPLVFSSSSDEEKEDNESIRVVASHPVSPRKRPLDGHTPLDLAKCQKVWHFTFKYDKSTQTAGDEWWDNWSLFNFGLESVTVSF